MSRPTRCAVLLAVVAGLVSVNLSFASIAQSRDRGLETAGISRVLSGPLRVDAAAGHAFIHLVAARGDRWGDSSSNVYGTSAASEGAVELPVQRIITVAHEPPPGVAEGFATGSRAPPEDAV